MPEQVETNIARALRVAFGAARKRARASGRPFTLTLSDVGGMLSDQGGLCAVSGLRFSLDEFPTAFVKRPFAPSLDRIDCASGYTLDNVRLVCTAVNFGLGQWGDEVFLTIARATLARQQAVLMQLPTSTLDERIDAATALISLVPEAERPAQVRRVAALKRARTLGPEGLKRAAGAAHAARAVSKRK